MSISFYQIPITNPVAEIANQKYVKAKANNEFDSFFQITYNLKNKIAETANQIIVNAKFNYKWA